MRDRRWIAIFLAGVSTFAGADCRDIYDPRWETSTPGARVAEAPARTAVENAAAAGPAQSSNDKAQFDLARVSLEQVNVLRRARTRIVEAAKGDPVVIVCEYRVINAVAVGQGPNVPPSGLVAITTAMMSVIGTDEAMAASLLAHELAHLMLQHGLLRLNIARSVARQATIAGTASENVQPGSGLPVARAVFAVQFAAYSREIERQADDMGYELFLAAGYDPRGATRLFETVRAIKGGGETAYLGSHPGLNERISRTLALARDDSKRAAAVENTSAIALDNDRFRVRAEELVRDRRWGELSGLVDSWLATLSQSGLGWYYRGLLMNRSARDRNRAWEAFARGAELDPARAEIWEALVEALLAAGHRREAAACISAMMASGLGTRELRERLFDGKLLVDGRSRRVLSEMWWSREPSGSRFITNDRTLFTIRGVAGESIPADWMPVK